MYVLTVKQIHIGIQNVRNKLLPDDLESSSKFKIGRCHPETTIHDH